MRVCSVCGETNEDWMDICQRCGNSINNADVYPDPEPQGTKYVSKRNKNVEYNVEVNNYNNNDYNDNNNYNNSNNYDSSDKSKKPVENMDLKLILLILIIVLVILSAYTLYVVTQG